MSKSPDTDGTKVKCEVCDQIFSLMQTQVEVLYGPNVLRYYCRDCLADSPRKVFELSNRVLQLERLLSAWKSPKADLEIL